MTCIAGIAQHGHVWIGGDSAGVAGWDLTVRADAKVFMNDGIVFGFTDSFRMGDILRYHLAIPQHDSNEDVRAFMVRRFIPEVRRVLKEHGWITKSSEQESGGTFLVGYTGRLFRISSDFQVGESSDMYDAVGCGSNYALGAFHVTQGIAPNDRILMALKAAEHHSAGVRGPFVQVSTKDRNVP